MNVARQTTRGRISVRLALTVVWAGLLLVCLHPGAAAAATPQLPNLVADPPNNVALETSTTEGGLKGSGEAKLLLRFNGYLHNVGPGALDFRGSRSSPSESMHAFQRVYNSDGSFNEEPSSAELVYVEADGHEHFHLQRAAKYSLWNAARSAEVAPAQKVGFCLDDSEQVESGGPKEAVYSDATGRKFCRQHEPEALSLFEGVSKGWRDRYSSSLAFQWVDASNVLPGEYWLREDVNPTGVIKETGGSNAPGYATSATIIPGFNALPQTVSTEAETPKTVTLTSKKWNGSATPEYKIASPPQHGSLSGPAKGSSQVIYTPEAGYSGPDSFIFYAKDPNSPFPRSPATATVSIEVAAPPAPTLSLNGAPASMVAGTSIQLSASVANDNGGVSWEASAGSVTPEGTGLSSIYTAPSEPPPGKTVTVTARLSDNPGVVEQRTITIAPLPPNEPAVSISSEPGTGAGGTGAGGTGGAGGAGGSLGYTVSGGVLRLARPDAVLIGRKVILTMLPPAAGRIRLTAYLGAQRLGSCAADTPAGRRFTCRLTLTGKISTRARIGVRASLRIGTKILNSYRPPSPIPPVRVHISGPGAFAAGSAGRWQFLCGPLSE
jgi:hypothetical protein